MEQVFQVTGLCVVSALLALVLRKGNPEQALLLTLAAAAAALLLVSGPLESAASFLRELGRRSGLGEAMLAPLYKTVGIALVVKAGGGLCRDAGASALASAVETAGTVCALLVSLPLLRAVLDIVT